MVAQALVVVLTQCKNDLSRENVMAQAANLKGVALPMLMPRRQAQHLADGLPSDQGRLYGRVSRQPVQRDQRAAAGDVKVMRLPTSTQSALVCGAMAGFGEFVQEMTAVVSSCLATATCFDG